jgi:hypothetical protein
MTWSELARSGSRERAEVSPASGQQSGGAQDGGITDGETADAQPTAARKPPRRRRQGGISQRE